MNLMLLAHQPAAPLTSYVEKLWYCDGYQGVHRKERILPNGKFQLVIGLTEGPLRAPGSPTEEWGQLAPSLVLGIRSHYSVIHTAALQSAMGVVFWPGGARVFFDSPADAFYNESVPLDLLWGSKASELRDRLRAASTAVRKFRVLEIALLECVKKGRELHTAVGYALREFARAPHIRSVLEVTKEAGLSRRRFAQLFREQVGLTPKLFCRLHRFRGVLQQIALGAPVDWADVALAGGLLRSVAFGSRIPRFLRHLTQCVLGKRANGCESAAYRLNEVHILTRHRRGRFERLCPCLRRRCCHDIRNRPDLSVRARSQ